MILIFAILALVILVSSVLAITSSKMMHVAMYLLFVLASTAGLYFLLDYHFLGVVQLSVYAGGVLILFIFAILLTNTKGERSEIHGVKRIIPAVLASLLGIGVITVAVMKHTFLYADKAAAIATGTNDAEINMKVIGNALMGTEKYQYLMPFEVLSVLLLACIIGGILIARKR
ncbi:MAG: NADH-quinone oxidoreductase subunit J [Bacteroidales bacterium]|nr:NADH-quinone oxidoreductase subunit J [Bacteroidales bacterium]